MFINMGISVVLYAENIKKETHFLNWLEDVVVNYNTSMKQKK